MVGPTLPTVRSEVDVLYEKIWLTKLEDELTHTEAFRRLTRIKQLGTAREVYRAATHTRDTHSLGSMCLVDKIIRWFAERLREKGTIVIEDIDLQNFRIAALLHDIGHGPYSHALENVLKRNQSYRPLVRSIDGGSRAAIHHEDFTVDMILSGEGGIQEVFTRNNIDNKKIAKLVLGECDKKPLRYLGQVISGDLDVDRIDYTLRDSYHTGIKGVKEIISIEELIKAFDVEYDENYESYIFFIPEEKMSIIDLFLHVRFFFLISVPLNWKVRCSDLMLTKAVEYALEKEEQPEKKVREIFTKMDDEQLRLYLQNSNKRSKDLLGRVEDRQLYRSVEFKIKNLEPHDRYNFFKLSQEFDLYRKFESKLINLIRDRLIRDRMYVNEIDLITDFNFPEAFPIRLLLRRSSGDLAAYFDYSPLIRGIGKSIFEASVVHVYYDKELVGKYLETLYNVILDDILKPIIKSIEPQDTDKLLMLLETLDKLARSRFKIDDPEFTGAYFKGLGRLNTCILYLKERGVSSSYRFEQKIGKANYDEKLWKDMLALSNCGMVYERVSPVIQSPPRPLGKLYRERSDFQITRFGRKYISMYLTSYLITDTLTSLLKEEWERQSSLIEEIRKSQNVEEELREKLMKAHEMDNIDEIFKLQKELELLTRRIRDLKKEVFLLMDYREDIF